MKYFIFLLGLITFSACSSAPTLGKTNERDLVAIAPSNDEFSDSTENDLSEITELIRKATARHESNGSIEPGLWLDSATAFSGILLNDLKLALEELTSTEFFTEKFIQNYENIYLTIDEKLRTGEMVYEVGTQPPYGSGANPWCNCQDVPYDEPNPFEEIEIETIDLTETTGKFNWKWAKVDPNSDWGQRRYYFEVEKVDGKWRIDHLEGFTMKAFFHGN